jgi:hypothetical protein
MSHRLGTARSAAVPRLLRGLVVALGLAIVGLGPEAQAKDRLPPEYGTMRDRALAPDFAAGGALIGGVAIPLLVAIPPWDAYTSVTRDSVIDSAEGRSVAVGMIVQAELIGIGAGTGLAFTGWMLGGGYRTGRWHWALLGGLGGSAVGAGLGTGLGLVAHQPWTGRAKNASGEREWVLGYGIGLFTLTAVTAVGTTAGVVLAGGKVEGKARTEVQLVLGTQRDIRGRSVTTPSLRGRF